MSCVLSSLPFLANRSTTNNPHPPISKSSLRPNHLIERRSTDCEESPRGPVPTTTSTTLTRSPPSKQTNQRNHTTYDVLCTISSASQRNSTLEVDIRRSRKNGSVLASRLQEARFIIWILEVFYTTHEPCPFTNVRE